MAISRRQLLTGAVATLAAATLPARASVATSASLIVTAATFAGEYLAIGIANDGALTFETPLPARAHGIAARPNSSDIAIASRRPGSYISILNGKTGATLHEIAIAPSIRLCGHLTFLDEGNVLAATEIDLATGEGALSLYDPANGYKRLSRIATGGKGPHTVIASTQPQTALVANGGFGADTTTGEDEIDPKAIASSLVVIDVRKGIIAERTLLAPELHTLSIRHLAIAPSGTVFAALQDADTSQSEPKSLGVRLSSDGSQTMFTANDDLWSRFKFYTGDIALDVSGDYVAMSSPRGGIVGIWRTDDLSFVHSIDSEDCCALLPGNAPGRFIADSGTGELFEIDALARTQKSLVPAGLGLRFDNHAIQTI